MISRLVLLALGAFVAVGLAACGGGSTPSTPNERPSGVVVVAQDIHFSQHTYSATAGAVVITYRNDGALAHTLMIDGVDGFKLSVPAHGDVDKATVQLKPGEYTLYCDMPGHRQAGMQATLQVR